MGVRLVIHDSLFYLHVAPLPVNSVYNTWKVKVGLREQLHVAFDYFGF